MLGQLSVFRILTGTCTCPGANYNEDCSVKICLYNCSGKGNCDENSGNCECNLGYSGLGCEKIFLPCLDPSCQGRGICNTTLGYCICRVGYSGQDCSLKLCPQNCTYPNGTCNFTTGIYECDPPHNGTDCSLLSCPGDCIHDGKCDPIEGECKCGSNWTGPICNIVRCPSDCSGNGACVGGVCNCGNRWSGDSCNVQEPDYVFITLLAIGLALAGLALMAGGFALWRYLTIQRLLKQKERQQEMGENEPDPNSMSADSSEEN